MEPRVHQQEDQQRAAHQHVAAIAGNADRRIHDADFQQAGFKPDHVSEHQGHQDDGRVPQKANGHQFLVRDPWTVPVSKGEGFGGSSRSDRGTSKERLARIQAGCRIHVLGGGGMNKTIGGWKVAFRRGLSSRIKREDWLRKSRNNFTAVGRGSRNRASGLGA